MSADQWNEYGDCDICRRKNYCKKQCKPAMRRESSMYAMAMASAMFNVMVNGSSNKNDSKK